MPKASLTLLEKISQSEAKIKELIEERKKELMDIFTKNNALVINDKLLVGFLIFALNPENKDHPTLKEFKELGNSSKTPSKRKLSGNNSAKKAH